MRAMKTRKPRRMGRRGTSGRKRGGIHSPVFR